MRSFRLSFSGRTPEGEPHILQFIHVTPTTEIRKQSNSRERLHPLKMSDSEDSDLEQAPDAVRHKTKIIYQSQFPYIHMEPPDVIYERWSQIKPEVKKRAGHMMHIYVFWRHILLRQQENHPTTSWAVDMGFLDSNVSNDLSLKRLEKIEILESVLEAMEIGLSQGEMERKAWGVLSISRSFSVASDRQHRSCLSEAVHWLVESGAPHINEKLRELGSLEIRYCTLRFIFSEYSRYLQVMSCSKRKALEELRLDPDSWSLLKSEEMKNKGNEQFQKKKYDMAVKWYTKAIKYHPNNHILYGNRALCFLRSEKYLKALGDGKRAVILQPDWAKGHYRLCDALFYLGEHQKALEANRLAQSTCRTDVEGHKDLLQQYEKFQRDLQENKAEGKSKKMETKNNSSKIRDHSAGGLSTQHIKSSCLSEPASASVLQSENLQHPREDSGTSEAKDRLDSYTDLKSEMPPRKNKKSANLPEKATVGNKSELQLQESASEAAVRRCFCAAVQEAVEALKDQRSRNAQQSFSLAISMLDSRTIMELGLSELDKCVLIYGHAVALLEIGLPEELAEAQRLFTKLESSERKFQSLVHYGMGRVYLKENRFAEALEQFSDALLMIQRHITPGKLTWPTTKILVDETQSPCLQEHLENFVEICTFPPKPDAICCHSHCLAHTVKIYFSDPDFKGFIQLICCQSCRVEFHITCWKKLKTLSFMDKNDKDFLKYSCFTPDCEGQICHIVIFGSTGLIKCEFETSIPKIRPFGRLRIKQQCTSIKKLKSKSDRKLKRKQHRLVARAAYQEKTQVIAADVLALRAAPTHSVYADHILHQIHENKELFKEETMNISCVVEHLRPWVDLYGSKEHKSVLKSFRDDILLSELLDLLLESRNRVCVRVFIETLCCGLQIKPKLQQLAQHLNNAGLRAAQLFVSQYSSHLQTLDLKPLLMFTPLHDALIKNFVTAEELWDSSAFAVMEYLRQAPPREMRLFIWTLESNREQYESCHSILDHYFEDDAVCLVIKKTDDDENINTLFKSKNRHRKKKQKELKPVIVLSGMRAGHSRDEDEEDSMFSEDDPLMFPFSIPDHLRSQLAEFEEQYAGSVHRSYYDRILDNNADATKESLYDYFAQVLEEHGPLSASDPLLVGELENFPPEAQQKIVAAGGLEAFLLESLRFFMTDNVIGLMRHMMSLSDPSHTLPCNSQLVSHLNPSAKEFWPQTKDTLPDHFSPLKSDSILLPDPYVFDSCAALQLHETAGEYASAKYSTAAFESSLHSSESSAGETQLNRTVSVQVFNEYKDVSINTEPYTPFERNNGDMIQKEKQTVCLLGTLQQMKEESEGEQQRRRQQILVLQEELETITHSMQIASAELGLFQQKLEDEVKKDQQEKRENQETLKMLKMDIKDMTDVHESLTRDIREKNTEYGMELGRFLDISNQSAGERMSLEEEIKRYRDLCVRAQRRSVSAQLSVLQSRQDYGLRRLRAQLSEGLLMVKHLTEMTHRFSSAVLLAAIDEWTRFTQDIKNKISNTEMEFDNQMKEVKKGSRLCSLPPVSVPSSPAAPAVPVNIPGSHYTHLYGPSELQQPAGHTKLQSAVKFPEESLATTAAPQQHIPVYDRMLERLNMMFPHYNRLVLNKFIQEVRLANRGTLSTLTYDDVINRVAQLILDHQENTQEHMSTLAEEVREVGSQGLTSSDSSDRVTRTPPPTHVWKNVSEKHRNAELALNMEDPCIICHEEMSAEDVCVLECRHSFHRQCIKSWLKEQSTCPTCREHALLPEDFPLLPGRHRKNQTPAAAFN